MVTAAVALALLLVSTLGIERSVRGDQDARTLQTTSHDSGSQLAVSAAFIGALVVMVVAAVAWLAGIARVSSGTAGTLVGAAGLALMVVGIAIRVAAMRALGDFYSRTLRVTGDHRVVSSGPYRYVRHPGYLGMILVLGGADVATSNWIGLIAGPVFVVTMYLYRIRAEEEMLRAELGGEYVAYAARTRRLIPFLY